MPRLSQAEKRQRVEEERRLREQAEWDAFAPSYPLRLLNLVFEYSNRPELDVRKDAERNSFVFSRPREMNDRWLPFELNVKEYSRYIIRAIEEAEWNLSELVEAEKEAQRLYARRQQALSKLDAEDRAVLNL